MDVDRRDYVRIHDTIFVNYRVVAKGDLVGDEAPLPYEVSPRFLLLRDLYRIELESQQLLREMHRADEQLASFLTTVNRRLEVIAQVLAADELPDAATPAQEVTLGEGGISFRVHEILQEGTLLGLKLLFDSSLLGLVMFGQVRYSRIAQDSDHYIVGVQFLDPDLATRELLARHIIHRQAVERRTRLASEGFADADPI